MLMKENLLPNDVELDEFFRSCIEIDPLDLNSAYVKMPANFAYWSEKYAQALRSELRLEQLLRNTESQLRIEKRELLELNGSRVTESMVESSVIRDPGFQKAKFSALEAEVDAVRLKGRVESIRMVRDMLSQLGAQVRAEMQGDPIVRAQHSGSRSVRE